MARPRYFTDEQILEIHKWYIEENLRTLQQAALRLDTSDVTIISHFRRLGLETKPRGGKTGTKRGQRITLYCEVCQEPFELLESVYRARTRASDKPRFCSQKCMGIAQTIPESRTTVRCDNCEVEFEKPTRFLKEINYCSRECAGEGRKKPGARWRDPNHIKVYMREYRVKNWDVLNPRHKAYLKKHKQARLLTQKRYRQTHKAHISFLSRARKYKITLGNFTESDWETMRAECNYTCLACKRPEPEIKLTIDHVIPLSRGGTHDKSNIQPLCGSCNSAKGTKCTDYR